MEIYLSAFREENTAYSSKYKCAFVTSCEAVFAFGGLLDFGFGSGLAGLAGAAGVPPPAERKNPVDPVVIDAAKGADLNHYHN